MLFIPQVVRHLDGTEEEWEIPRSEVELGDKLGQGNYIWSCVQRTADSGSHDSGPMIYVHKKEMDFEGKSHLDVAVKMLRCKCIQLAATAHHYLLGLLAYAHIRTMYMGIYLYKDGGGCV